jgi:Protein of unknown function (DUF2911)
LKHFKLLFTALFFTAFCLAQNNNSKPTELDKSPMDVSYLPNNYPLLKLNGKVKDLPIARLLYSRPQKNGRTIFDGLVKYNDLWRLGANEATEIELFKPIKINNKTITKGRYTIYCIPTEDKWTLIISKDNFCWGNFMYDKKNDIARVEVKVEKTIETTEVFTAYFDDSKAGKISLVFMWENLKVQLPIAL